MLAVSLQSGSSGNCIYVEAAGVRLLFDAGLSGRQAELRLERHGRDIRDVDALIISHDHGDHIGFAGIYQRKYGLPVYATNGTMKAARRKLGLGRMHDVRHFVRGDVLDFGSVAVETVPTEHDAADGVGFVVVSEGKRLGILTDLGHVFGRLERVMASLDAVFIESNYDPDRLATGRYPEYVKQRIRGPKGHLSNIEAAELVAAHGKRLTWACLAHLSEENNDPDLALETARGIVGKKLTLHVATRYRETGKLKV
ncbi:MAG: MBL fold metallo-hydrolase [Pseudomonadota bacterium]